jgi:hypothetical protein
MFSLLSESPLVVAGVLGSDRSIGSGLFLLLLFLGGLLLDLVGHRNHLALQLDHVKAFQQRVIPLQVGHPGQGQPVVVVVVVLVVQVVEPPDLCESLRHL